MSVLDKARELGAEISISKELISLKEAEEMMLKDQGAEEVLKEFNEKQQSLQVIQSQGMPLTEGQKRELEELELKMLNNPYVYNFFTAQQEFYKVLEAVNNIISEAIGVRQQGCECGDECCGCGDENCGN
ncbi:MAG: YlbF family regulator [Syntrophomonadaceae bacterium]|nr:YlbF family regulator [Syntrophomonadaceae bacterium]